MSAPELLVKRSACVFWLAGLSSAGKTMIAGIAERRLPKCGYQVFLPHASARPFIEVFVDTPAVMAWVPDPKGLYRRALRGRSRVSPESVRRLKCLPAKNEMRPDSLQGAETIASCRCGG